MEFPDFQKELLGKLSTAKKLSIVGIGADLREDDAVGNYLARELIKNLGNRGELEGITLEYSEDEMLVLPWLFLLNASVVPEQYILRMLEFSPDLVVIIDAAQMGEAARPGDISFIDRDEIVLRTGSTHTISVGHFIEILKSMGSGATFITIGVQPKLLDYGEDLSEPVERTKVFLLELFSNFILNHSKLRGNRGTNRQVDR
ncbi:MAG: hydrogenase maturation protease [Promethearchaeota archaeon]